jgi:hypothetical protein
MFAREGLFVRPNAAPETAACGADGAGAFTLGAPDVAGLAPYISCAARAAQRVASMRIAAASGAPAAEAPPDSWMLFLATDSPGLQALLPAQPSLAARLVACTGATCAVENTAHKGRRTHAAQLQAVTELYILGMADAVVPIARSTFQRFADRGFGFGGRPQFLSGVACPPGRHNFHEQTPSRRYEKRLPVCAALGGALAPMEKAYNATCEVRACVRACVRNVSRVLTMRCAVRSLFCASVLQHARYALLSDWLVTGLNFTEAAPAAAAAGAP